MGATTFSRSKRLRNKLAKAKAIEAAEVEKNAKTDKAKAEAKIAREKADEEALAAKDAMNKFRPKNEPAGKPEGHDEVTSKETIFQGQGSIFDK